MLLLINTSLISHFIQLKSVYKIGGYSDKLRALCVSYVNLAWLGFPFALALFGPEISAAMVALYVGGSIFGNIWAVTAVSLETQSYSLP